MKKYRPDMFYSGYGMGRYIPTMEEDPDGKYYRVEDVGWKRNCGKTPLPTNGDKFLVNVCGEDEDGKAYNYIDIEWYDKRLGEFLPGTPLETITHWMEIPEVER